MWLLAPLYRQVDTPKSMIDVVTSFFFFFLIIKKKKKARTCVYNSTLFNHDNAWFDRLGPLEQY